jgi:cell division transport system ATP-binding protein
MVLSIMIEVRHLSHNFGSHWALKDCSFRLKKGEFLFLSGPSGAGKTTLLRLLFAGMPVQRGEAKVAGFNLNKIRVSEVPLLRRQVSVVFQDFKILPERSVYDNVILPLQVRGLGQLHADRRVRAVVRALGLETRQNLPCGELSGGEQQRVAVARAFVVNPQVLLADEPTGNLDAELSFRLMDLFKQFQVYGTTMIVATHSQELLRRHPEARVIRLEDGMITGANWPCAAIYPAGAAAAPRAPQPAKPSQPIRPSKPIREDER